jgi:hypothetical protein
MECPSQGFVSSILALGSGWSDFPQFWMLRSLTQMHMLNDFRSIHTSKLPVLRNTSSSRPTHNALLGCGKKVGMTAQGYAFLKGDGRSSSWLPGSRWTPTSLPRSSASLTLCILIHFKKATTGFSLSSNTSPDSSADLDPDFHFPKANAFGSVTTGSGFLTANFMMLYFLRSRYIEKSECGT